MESYIGAAMESYVGWSCEYLNRFDFHVQVDEREHQAVAVQVEVESKI
jgi:hypothetical protein